MKKIIHNLRQKKHEERRHVVHIALFVCLVLLIALFVWTLNANFRNNKDNLKDDFREFDSLKENLSSDYQDINSN